MRANDDMKVRVFVSSYHLLNTVGAGMGIWINLNGLDKKQFYQKACSALRVFGDTNPELLIADWELPVLSVKGFISEFGISQRLWQLLSLNNRTQEKIWAYLTALANDGYYPLASIDELKTSALNCFVCHSDSLGDFLKNVYYADDLRDLNETLIYAIDWNKVEQDFVDDYRFVSFNGKGFVFSCY